MIKEITFGKKARDKYKLIENGTKKELNNFFDNILTKGLNSDCLIPLVKSENISAVELSSVVVILVEEKDKIGILDIITKSEYKYIKNVLNI